ncbi:hypothetical protein C3433_17360 [Citrobacter freundii]|uniref:Uncharacterized protein n=1 Tax=Citrobacter arsenatis TaxID=2546350 RepID=A0A4P6WRT8_9ENTR|nr:hypothetical protein C3433_17360 [Citrobacter freundii]QBM23668.1 hypothetical protein E1B03_14995 [Citrobacter arsenatis]
MRELNAFKILWPHANAELVEPHLFIRFRCNVKKQVAGLYAQRLAEQGYILITADAAMLDVPLLYSLKMKMEECCTHPCTHF